MEARRNVVICCAVLAVFLMVGVAWADDDPNVFNQTMGLSVATSGTMTANASCGWKTVAVRNGTQEEGSDGGQLTIELDTCKVFSYEIEQFPQIGGAGGTAELEVDDLIIVWDEDATHGEDENQRNFSFTGTYDKLEEADYEGYLRLTTTDSRTNWGVYLITAEGTFTKGSLGTNEHEVLHLTRNMMSFWKVDDIPDANCVSPGNDITYSICWTNDFGEAVEDVYIIDWLPAGVDYNYVLSIDPLVIDPNYNIEDHSYRWDLGDLDPNDGNCVYLTVTVNEKAEPGYYLYNLAEMYVNDAIVAADDEYTDVCCWGEDPNTIYVDETATDGDNTGMNWADAYTDLADALERASTSVCVNAYKIYVAKGEYNPENTPNESFELPDNCSVYGGFKPGGCDFSERNPKHYETILTGLIDEDSVPDVDDVVTMGDECLLDGFTVTKSTIRAIYGDGVDFAIANCIIENNDQYGIRSKDGNVTIQWCRISSNERDGVRHEGADYDITIENSWIMRNSEHGIYCLNSTPTILNSIVSESDLAEEGREGIRMINPTSMPKLYNATIANNKAEGVFFTDNDAPGNLDWPDIQNCILYYNNNGGDQLKGIEPDDVAYYSCIQDCNDVNFNISAAPQFAYEVDPNGAPDPNNYHLAYDSRCIDAGSPLLAYTDQVDIDGEGTNRKYGSYVDIGADEVYDCEDDYLSQVDISNDLDWDADGIVNLVEFSKFSKAWLSYDPNHPLCDPNHVDFEDDPNAPGFISDLDKQRYNVQCDLVADLTIDLLDIEEFLSDTPWLWIACWKAEQMTEATAATSSGGAESMMMAAPLMSTMSLESASVKPVEEEKVYTQMSNSELVPLVTGIHEVLNSIEDSIDSGHKNAENLVEAKEFLEDVLSDIEASRQ